MSTSIAEWLRSARLSQRHPETGRPWSQEYAVERIREEAGWPTLYRPNYVGYENGKGMEPETLDRLVAFWARHGVEAPDLTPAAPALSLEERAVLAAERQAAALERQAEAAEAQLMLAEAQLTLLSRQLAALERVAGITGSGQPDLRAVEETRAWALEALAEARSPRRASPAGQ